jgi:eukaryotic-like serine/threonine-protein kinase
MSRVGKLLKDHELLGVIGEGGMGVVYRAQHVVIEKPVAIKVLHDHFARQQDVVEQFVIEAKAASRIRHPNIIDITDFGTTPDGLVFLVMEYLEGESLEDRLRRVHRLPIFEAVSVAKQVARGLGAAHELGIAHRDLKPANIFLCARESRRRGVRHSQAEEYGPSAVAPEDDFDLVKLLDFGVAKFLDLGPSAATRAGVLCGTPYYLSPEQARHLPATECSDIYSLGAVFYEMLTGTVPFGGQSMLEVLNGHVKGSVEPPSQRASDAGISEGLDALISMCLEKDPARRIASADEFCDVLDGCVSNQACSINTEPMPESWESGLAPATGADAEAADDDPDNDDRLGDTVRIKQERAGRMLRLTVLGALLLAATGGAVWAFGGSSRGNPSVPAVVATGATPTQSDLPPPVPPPAVAAPEANPQPAAPAPTSPTNKPPGRGPGKPAGRRAGEAGAERLRVPAGADHDAPAPSRPSAVDVDALVREAEQAWTRQHYAVALDKARAALRVDPVRRDAHMIIALCSCALEEVAAARRAFSHLDGPARDQVRAFCNRSGVFLE